MCASINEILRKVTIQVDEFADSFDRYGYLSTSAPFLLSLHRLRGGDFNEVTSVDLAEWGPSWVLVNDEFENELLGSEWEDLKGRKFLVWDGNRLGCHESEIVIFFSFCDIQTF